MLEVEQCSLELYLAQGVTAQAPKVRILYSLCLVVPEKLNISGGGRWEWRGWFLFGPSDHYRLPWTA